MGEILGETILFFVLNFIGGSIRWCFASLWHYFFNTPKHSYKDYIHNPDSNSLVDDEGTGCFNIIIGILFIAVVVAIIYKVL